MSDFSSCSSLNTCVDSDNSYSSVSSLSDTNFVSSSSENDKLPSDGVDLSVKRRKQFFKLMHSYTTKTSEESEMKAKEEKLALKKIRQRMKGAKRMHRFYVAKIIQLKKIIKELRRKKTGKFPLAKKRKYHLQNVKRIN